MKNILTITISAILIFGLFSAPVIAMSREDILFRLTSQSNSHSIFDRLDNYQAPDISTCPDDSCQGTTTSNVETSDSHEDGSPATSMLNEIPESRIASFNTNSIRSSQEYFTDLTRVRMTSYISPVSMGSSDMISKERAICIAISQMEARYTCPVQLIVTKVYLGTSAPAYATSNPCWYITIEGDFTNVAECSQCGKWVNRDGSDAVYMCIPVGGIVVIDAMTGEVQMASVYK